MLRIRRYQPGDREAVRRICMDTAKGSFRTKPKKREAVAAMFIDYNLECEPEHCFVAEEDGRVCGYCAYSADMDKLRAAMHGDLYRRVFHINPVYAWFMRGCAATSAKLAKRYGGGGFHLNVEEGHQGQKIGPKLLAVMGKHLAVSLGYRYMYLVTENRRTRGYSFYRHFGFVEAARCGLGTLCLTYDLSGIDERLGKYGIDFNTVT